MTGFGRGRAGRGKNKIEIEIRSVNSRYLDVKFKGLVLDLSLENEIKKILFEDIQRGSIQIRFEPNADYEIQKFSFNKERFDLIKQILKNIHVEYGQKMNLSDIISIRMICLNDHFPTAATSIFTTVASGQEPLCQEFPIRRHSIGQLGYHACKRALPVSLSNRWMCSGLIETETDRTPSSTRTGAVIRSPGSVSVST